MAFAKPHNVADQSQAKPTDGGIADTVAGSGVAFGPLDFWPAPGSKSWKLIQETLEIARQPRSHLNVSLNWSVHLSQVFGFYSTEIERAAVQIQSVFGNRLALEQMIRVNVVTLDRCSRDSTRSADIPMRCRQAAVQYKARSQP